MNKQRDDFKKLKIDIDACLDSFISAFAYLEQIADSNDCVFEGKLALEEARTVYRIIDEIDSIEGGGSVITTCLNHVSSQCKAVGLDAMTFEAMTIAARMEAFKDNSDKLVSTNA
jgi:hypothetical protein